MADSDGRIDPAATVVASERRPVDVARIERELAQIWAAQSPDQAGGQAVMRACVLNLIVYAPSAELASHASEAIARVDVQAPCRAIVVVAEPDYPGEEVDAWVSAHCHRPRIGAPQICCEEITISVRGAAVKRIPNVVLPLLIGDLPVAIWWLAEADLTGEAFRRLAALADWVAIDSAEFHDVTASFGLLSQGTTSHGHRWGLRDLNWTRLTPWRELIAQFFDSAGTASRLADLDSIEVEFGNPGAACGLNQAQGLLLVGWLISRLGWRTSDGLATRRGQPAKIALRRAANDAAAVRLRASHPRAGFSVVASPGSGCVTTVADVPDRPPLARAVDLSLSDDAALLVEEIQMVGRDRIYEETLATLVRATGSLPSLP